MNKKERDWGRNRTKNNKKKVFKPPLTGAKYAMKAFSSRMVEQARVACLLNHRVLACSTKHLLLAQP